MTDKLNGVAPKCPLCGSDGHHGGEFELVPWAEDVVIQHGLDPLRTGLVPIGDDVVAAFHCLKCNHAFPMTWYKRESMKDFHCNLFHEDGSKVYDGNTETFWINPDKINAVKLSRLD